MPIPEYQPTELETGGINAMGRMLGLLGDQWTLLIIQQAMLGATRYQEFTARLPISNSVLTNRLRTLHRDGLLDRHIYQHNPIRAEYLLTARSRALWPVLLSVWEWERRWVPEHIDRLPRMRHRVCGTDFAPMLTCRSCGDTVTEKDLTAKWGPSGSWARCVPEAFTRRRSDPDQSRASAGLFPQTMSVFGNRWAAALLISAFAGATRFTHFQSQLGAPPGSIAQRLGVFCTNGVLTGADGYHLTEKGRAFFPVLITALQWAQQWFRAPEGPAVMLTHRACGQPFTGIAVCDQCAQPLAGPQVTIVDQLT